MYADMPLFKFLNSLKPALGFLRAESWVILLVLPKESPRLSIMTKIGRRVQGL